MAKIKKEKPIEEETGKFYMVTFAGMDQKEHINVVKGDRYEVSETGDYIQIFSETKSIDDELVASFKTWLSIQSVPVETVTDWLCKSLDKIHPDKLPKEWGKVDGKDF